MSGAGAFSLLLLAWLAGAQAPLAVRDIDGRASTPLTPPPGAVHLVFVLSPDCPVSNRYAAEIDRIVTSYGSRGVRAWFVFADADEAAVRANLKAFHPTLNVPAVIDRDQRLIAAIGASITPEAAVYTDSGRRYRGRIDNLYVTLGQSRREATEHDLREALDAALAGRPIARPETQAIGCFIERKTGW